MEHDHFLQVVQHGWSLPVFCPDPANMARFKILRRVLKAWQAHVSTLSLLLEKIKILLQLLEVIEEYNDLFVPEWNFKSVLNEKLSSLLHQQKYTESIEQILNASSLVMAIQSFFMQQW